MSTALRIASVTYVLKDLLNNGFIDHDIPGGMGGGVKVTALPPDKIDVSANGEVSQLNLFMYQATPNQGWRNMNLPAYNNNGDRITNPPLAIDLHYILTAYGSAELHTDILMGYGMQLLHETPVLPRAAIRKSLESPSGIPNASLPDSLKLLSTSNLAEQVEMIKITPEILNLEDISKLWAAMGAKYRPTAAYKVTVVLIESNHSVKKGLPVVERNIYVVPSGSPIINKIMSTQGLNGPIVENQKILSGYSLVLTGEKLSGDIMEVTIDGIPVPNANVSKLSDTQVLVILPPGLSAGLHDVKMAHKMLMGSPPVPHDGSVSNSMTFVLSPQITGNPVVAVTGATLKSGTVTLTADVQIMQGQKVVMYLSEAGGSHAYSSVGIPNFGSPPNPTHAVTFAINNVVPGKYLIRIEIDNAESPVDLNTVTPFINI